MKRFLAVLVAFAVAALPSLVHAEELLYDDASMELSVLLSADVAPAVQFDLADFPALAAGAYALDSVRFFFDEDDSTVDPATARSYAVTIQVWDKDLVALAPIVKSLDFAADAPLAYGWYDFDLTSEKLPLTEAVSVGIFLDATTPGLTLGADVDGAPATGNSYVYDDTATTTWTQDPLADYGIRANVRLVPALTCQGFLPPFDKTITMKWGGRNIPLKALLFDAEEAPVTRGMLAAPPVVAMYKGETNETGQVAPPGKSNSGRTFRSLGGGKWRYNLKTKKQLAAGTYMVQVVSGDATEYVIDPTCMGTIEVLQGPKNKPAPKGKKK